MTEATLLLEEPKTSTRQEPVECSQGHMNDPYPSDGKCEECGMYLPNNPDVFTPDSAAEGRKVRATLDKGLEEIARRTLDDEGMPWDEATEGLRQLAYQFAKKKNHKTLEMILQQIGSLKAKPKPGEEKVKTEYQVVLSGGSIEDLKRSLSDLEVVLRID